MNETIPPTIGIAPQPKTSVLAIWSLVLGILSLTCFSILTAIPGVICGHQALSKIRRSSGEMTGQGMAIAGLVTGYLGIAWAIIFIPLMMAIAIPNFVQARTTAQANACINNLRQIDAAKNEWALENSKTNGTPVTEADIKPYVKLDASGNLSKCPAGGTYTIGRVGELPTCSLGTTVTPAHVLPQ